MIINGLSPVARHCKTLQDIARHCKTLQDIARHCKTYPPSKASQEAKAAL